jgi:hypothetical protein
MNIVILLTGAVNPSPLTPFTAKQDIGCRVSEYINAISYCIDQLPDIPIIYVDSSGFDIYDHIHALIKERSDIYCLKYNLQSIAASRGKGRSELESIILSFDNVEVLRRTDYIVKINGRFLIRNISRFILSVNDLLLKNELTKNHILGDFRNNLSWFDSRIFCSTPEFFKEFTELYRNKINDYDDIYFEHCLAECVHYKLSTGSYLYKPFPTYPRIIGTSGSTGKSYNNPALYYAKLLIHRLKSFINAK